MIHNIHQVSPGQSIATVCNGVVLNQRVEQELHQFTTHWILSPEGAVATADALATTALASGAVTLIVSGVIANALIAGALEADDDTLFRMRRRAVLDEEDRINETLFYLGAQISIWAFGRVSRVLNEAKKDVCRRAESSEKFAFTLKPFKGATMPIVTNRFIASNEPWPTSVGQQLSNDEEPICPITLNAIPFSRRAISFQCSDRGRPSATIYDRDALFEWLNTHHIDPTNRKVINCVVDGNGLIIYPVQIKSENFQDTDRQISGISIPRRILAPGRPPMSKAEVEKRKAFRKFHSQAILKRVSSK